MNFESPTPIPSEPVVETPTVDPISLVLADALRELIWTGVRSAPRSMQTAAGMSEIGADCDRQLAYKVAGIPPSNLGGDPMPVIIGTGFHLHMEAIFSKLDPRRWLVETPVEYEGIPGTCDLYDRRRKTVFDWKSTSKAKLRQLRKDGPPRRVQTQIQLYGAAMAARGEDVTRVALVYVPRDGSLDDLWVWHAAPDQALVDNAVERYRAIANAARLHNDPGEVPAQPSRMCGYCDHFLPGSTDLTRGCPGQSN